MFACLAAVFRFHDLALVFSWLGRDLLPAAKQVIPASARRTNPLGCLLLIHWLSMGARIHKPYICLAKQTFVVYGIIDIFMIILAIEAT